MKRFFYLLCLLGFVLVWSQCGIPVNDVPDTVISEMEKLYPHVPSESIEWNIDRNGNYEAEYKVMGIKYRTDFMPNGSWLETERNVDLEDLPPVLLNVLKNNYQIKLISEIEKVQSAKYGNFYDVEFVTGLKKKDIMFRADGSIVSE